MTTGVVLSVDTERYGGTLTVATAATDLVLQVDDIVDFADEDDFAAGPQWLTVEGSAPMQYVSVDDDNDTVTLAATVGAVYEAGTPVRMWDAGAEVVSHFAWVELDDADPDDAPIPAEVRHDRMIFFGIDNMAGLIGARVVVEPDEDDPEVWHVAQIIGRETRLDGGTVAPGTLPSTAISDPENLGGGGPTAAPASSPTPEPLTGPAAVVVNYAPRPIGERATVDLYLATSATAPVDATTLHTEDFKPGGFVYADQSGANLTPGTAVWVALVARNSVGSSSPSAWVETSAGQVPEAYLQLLAGSVIAQRLQGETVTGTNLSGVTLDILDAIHAEPGYLDVKADVITAKSGIFEDNVTRRGENNYLEGRETASAGVSDPVALPSVTATWPYSEVPYPWEARRGLVRNMDDTQWITHDASYVMAWNLDFTVEMARGPAFASDERIHDITLVGDKVYALIFKWDAANSRWLINLRQLSAVAGAAYLTPTGAPDQLVYAGQVAHSSSTVDGGILTGDSTGLYVLYNNGTGRWKFRKVIWGGGTVFTIDLGSTSPMGDASTPPGFVDLHVGGGYLSASYPDYPNYVYVQTAAADRYRFFLTSDVDGPSYPKFDNGYNGSTVRPRTDSENGWAAFHHPTDGNFYYISRSRRLYALEDRDSTLSAAVSYTWYDGDSAGNGTAESLQSPTASFVVLPGSSFLVKTPLPPDDGTVDAPNTVRIYEGGWRQGAEYTAAELAAGRVLRADQLEYVNSAPATSGFDGRASTNPGGYASGAGDVAGPYWELSGDGSGRAGPLTWKADGTIDTATSGIGAAKIKLTPTMAGVVSHDIYVRQIVPGVVAMSGYLDVDDAVLTRRDTGMRIPAGMRPPTGEFIYAFPQFGGTGAYRYFVSGDDQPTPGMVEFEQSVGNNGPFESVSAVWFTN